MRVLLLHDPYKPIVAGSIGGEDNLVQVEINTLLALGHEVIDGRKFDPGWRRKPNQIRAQMYGSHRSVLELIEDSSPDVIHTHNLNQRSGYAWMKSTKTPIISSIHNYRLFCPISIAWRNGAACTECRDTSAIKAVVHRCDGLRGTINAARHLVFQRDYPQLHIPKILVISSEMMWKELAPIVDDSKFRLLRNPAVLIDRDDSNFRKGWIFAGRFVEEKGVINLIRNWPSDEILHLAGDGPLKELIVREISTKPNITLIGTYPPGENKIFSKYEGMFFPSTWFEGSPLVVVDCLGAGTPVICTSDSGAKEQVSISDAGYIIEGGLTTEAIRKAQSELRANFEKLSENARHSIQTTFSIGNWGSQLEKILTEAIS